MSNNFRVGQKVVCVSEGWVVAIQGYGPLPMRFPIRGCIYTVAGFYDYGAKVGMYLEEFPRDSTFALHKFRPAVKRGEETGMSILRKLLTDNKVDA